MAKCVFEYIKEQCSKKTTNYHHGNLKEELLKQAFEVIQNEGEQALTLAVLSKKVGTSRSAIYRHFSSKDDLMHHVFLEGFEIFDSKIADVFALKNKSVLQRLHIMGEEYIKFAIDHPNLYRILFGEKYQSIREDSCDIEDKEQAKGFHALIELLIEGQEEGILKIDVPMFQAQVIHSMVHGLSSLFIDGHIHIKDNIKPLYESCYQTMLKGIQLTEA